PAWVSERQEETRRHWQGVLDRVDIALPPGAEKVVRALKTNLAYILINRDGPAIRPGSRNYARSWIRDGALTSLALLQLGTAAEVREFIEWYARYQTADGKVPCCVDRRGADPVVENDSPGAFIFAAALAVVVGDDEHATKFAALRDAFRESVYASIVRTVADHGIDYIPGSVELGDFDPTSTAIAVVPGGEIGNLPEPALTRTFDRY